MDLHPSEHVLFSGHPSWRSAISLHLKGLGLAIVAAVVVWFAVGHLVGVLAGLAVLGIAVLIGAIKRWATHYVVTNERLHIRHGILSRAVQETRLARVQNVNTRQSVVERVLRVGTVDFDTAGSDDSDLTFFGIAEPEQVVQQVDRALREPSTPPPTDAATRVEQPQRVEQPAPFPPAPPTDGL